MSLHRSLQNGRHGESGLHLTGRLQVGQDIGEVRGAYGLGREMFFSMFAPFDFDLEARPQMILHVHVVSKNGTSCSV
jgi:hypothetical protein